MQTVGPLARSVEDLALALGLIAGPDGYDSQVPPVPLKTGEQPLKISRFIWTDDFGGVPVTNDTRSSLARLSTNCSDRVVKSPVALQISLTG